MFTIDNSCSLTVISLQKIISSKSLELSKNLFLTISIPAKEKMFNIKFLLIMDLVVKKIL